MRWAFQNMKTFFLTLSLLLLAGFGPETKAAPADDTTKQLRATLTPGTAEFKSSIEAKVHCTIKNTGSSAATIDTLVLGSSILSVEVLDAEGKRIPTVPPSVPPKPSEAKEFQKTLDAESDYEVTYSLNMFSPTLKPGTYAVRMSWIKSNTVEIKILESKPWWKFWR